MKEKNICRCCRKKKLFNYLKLGNQPLANSYHKGEKLPSYPLDVNVCQNCFHSQLSVVIDKDSMFRNYLYVSGTTSTFRKHTKDLAKDAVKRIKKNKLRVLDIACNDGTQLEHFRDLGCEVMGVDPAENLRAITEEKKIPVVVDYWTEAVARSINKKFDIITGTNVFAHVDNLDEFLKACKLALGENGVLILEFPYANEMIQHNEFDTVYHEHLSYFLVNSFTTLVTRLEFQITDVIQTQIHGGSIRFFLKKGKGVHSQKITQLIMEERDKGLLELNSYVLFAQRVSENKKNLRKLVTKLRRENKKVVGYGASAKGNTMLNYFKIKLDYIVDDNPLKWGYKTPGRNILIKSPESLREEKKGLYVLVLSWNFYNEIAKKIIKIRGEGMKDVCIVYVPTVVEFKLNEKRGFANSA